MKKLHARAWLAAFFSVATGVHGAPATRASLADLDLEQLSEIRVTSASRREERLVEAPASIFVITAEDIRRSGATSLPEVLRLAPNLQVVRADAQQYIVGARGGLLGTSNKMLVLIDGRTVYTPLFSGVFYDAIAVALDEIERIEVISGPGSTLWGTNAVNGVINVTTKSARRTEGGQVSAGAGNQESGGAARYGWSAGAGGSMRIQARYFDRDDMNLASGASAHDAGARWTAGFRGDWERPAGALTLQGDVYRGGIDNLGGVRDFSGGNLLARWRRDLASDSSLVVQAYYDRTAREHAGSFKEDRDTFDVEAQHSLRAFGAHRVTWGGGYRASRDETVPTAVLGFMPAGRTLSLASLFVQDEWPLAEKLRATLGLRAERNSYTGVEWLPNARLSYSVADNQVAWAALTRTVRSPSRIDRDLVVPGAPPFLIASNDSFQSEVADVVELGYRGQVGPRASFSLTAFHHRFEELRTLEPLGAGFVVANGAEGRVHGVEGWGELRPTPDWRVIAGFVVMHEKTTLLPGRVNLTDPPLGYNPRRTASLRSLWNVTPAVQLDFMLRYVAEIERQQVPSYTELNARIGWRVSPALDLSLVATNALDRDHVEFGSAAQRAVFEPGYFVRATWSF